jgi:hypothetical protein
MPSRIVHGGTIYLQNGSINVLAMLSDVYDIYDTQIDKTNFKSDTAPKIDNLPESMDM